MSSQHHLDKYKVPRESVDVESLAQELCRYLKITAEDTEFLSDHPARRDELTAKLYKQPGVQRNFSANQFVPRGGDPDTHLIPANAEIERLTPPATLEDRVARLQVASAALLVFTQYKVGYALLGHSDLERQVQQRKKQILDEWRKTEFARLFPESVKRASTTASATPPTRGSGWRTARPSLQPLSAAAASSASRPVSDDEAAQFLSDPSSFVGKRFVCSPPEDDDRLDPEDRGLWEVVSYRVHKDEGVVDREYMVLTEDLPEDPLPMGEKQVRAMLRYSTFAG
ncbi:hypothetical protein LXA43DRAFT_389838 [Ganoderma leucocontextum]|nr:hypothetical protein LXA43DRAFT_389838 [Ganoderma leucocontextum]